MTHVIGWIAKWLTTRKQQVLLDGESFDYIPSCNVWSAPRYRSMFLICINDIDIAKNISSKFVCRLAISSYHINTRFYSSSEGP